MPPVWVSHTRWTVAGPPEAISSRIWYLPILCCDTAHLYCLRLTADA